MPGDCQASPAHSLPSHKSIFSNLVSSGDEHSTTGIGETPPTPANNLILYPNPATNSLHIQNMKSNTPFVITNLLGETVEHGVLTEKWQTERWKKEIPKISDFQGDSIGFNRIKGMPLYSFRVRHLRHVSWRAARSGELKIVMSAEEARGHDRNSGESFN